MITTQRSYQRGVHKGLRLLVGAVISAGITDVTSGYNSLRLLVGATMTLVGDCPLCDPFGLRPLAGAMISLVALYRDTLATYCS